MRQDFFTENTLRYAGWARNKIASLASGEWIGCIQLTEPHTGSDAAAITTRATLDGDNYIIDGHKAFITAGATADIAMIIAVTDPSAGKRGLTAFITPTDNPGYEIVRKEEKLGHRTNDTCEIRLNGMRVPKSDVLGEIGRGLGIALSNFCCQHVRGCSCCDN